MGDSHIAATLDPAFARQVQEYLTEATSGPLKGGIAGELVVAGVTIDVAAARDWGVQFARTLPDGSTARERLSNAEVNLAGAGAAIGALLRAA